MVRIIWTVAISTASSRKIDPGLMRNGSPTDGMAGRGDASGPRGGPRADAGAVLARVLAPAASVIATSRSPVRSGGFGLNSAK